MNKLLIHLSWFLLPVIIVNNHHVNAAEIKGPPEIIRSNLKSGSQGVEVSELQATLKLLGYYTGVVDGIFSENTAKSVAQFQAAVGLQADGIVGGETWKKLFPLDSENVGKFNSSPAAIATNKTTNQPQTTTKINPVNPSKTSPTNPKIIPKIKVKNPPIVSTNNIKPKNSGDLPVLRLGMQGDAVEKLQQRLKVLGFFPNTVTGYFGTSTESAVKAAQTKFKMTADGIVGGETWRLLFR
jgi:peptidoglycan hydrolase-like protein with peptidoglycan-binding domain